MIFSKVSSILIVYRRDASALTFKDLSSDGTGDAVLACRFPPWEVLLEFQWWKRNSTNTSVGLAVAHLCISLPVLGGVASLILVMLMACW